MDTREKRWHRTDDKGEYLIQGGTQRTKEGAIKKRNRVEEGPEPEGYHYWTGRVQRSDRGRRWHWEVWFRKTQAGVRLR